MPIDLKQHFPKLNNAKITLYIIIIATAALLLTLTSLDGPLANGKTSFGDIQMYMTVAREMLSGKVLYADVFDHKGPWLYFLYVPAVAVDYWGTFGVFLLELAAFATTLVLTARFCLDGGCNPLSTAISTITVAIAMASCIGCVPGQAEYLSLPWLVYSLIAYIECVDHRRPLTRFEAVVIGLGLGWCFWAKFTICIFFALLAACLVWHYARTLRQPGTMAVHVAIVVACAAAMTIPVAIYFAACGDISLPVTDYLMVNLTGGYIGAEQGSSLLPFSILTVLLPLTGLFTFVGFIYCFTKSSMICKQVAYGCTVVAMGYFGSFLLMGRAATQYLVVELAFLVLWAPAFAAWLDRKREKAVLRTLISICMVPVLLFIALDTALLCGGTVFYENKEHQSLINDVTGSVEPDSTLFLYRIWDNSVYLRTKCHPAASTIGCYKLEYALERQDEELRQLQQGKLQADYVLVNEKRLQEQSAELGEVDLEAAGYVQVKTWEDKNLPACLTYKPTDTSIILYKHN